MPHNVVGNKGRIWRLCSSCCVYGWLHIVRRVHPGPAEATIMQSVSQPATRRNDVACVITDE